MRSSTLTPLSIGAAPANARTVFKLLAVPLRNDNGVALSLFANVAAFVPVFMYRSYVSFDWFTTIQTLYQVFRARLLANVAVKPPALRASSAMVSAFVPCLTRS